MARVAVVGGGFGGLAAAARLGARGHEVVLLEAAATVGGKLGRHVENTTQGRFAFDTGPSLLTMPSVFADLFAATGDALDRSVPLRRLDPVIRHRFGDGTVLTTRADLGATLAAVEDAFGPAARAGWAAVLDRGRRIWDASAEQALLRPLAPLALLRQARRDVATVAPGTSLRRLGRRLLAEPRLRLMLERYATYTGSDPRRAPATLATIPYLEQAEGVWYTDGGLFGLAAALAHRIVERGGRVRTGTPVTAVTTSAGRVDGVVLASGERVAADVVVSDVDARRLYRGLLPGGARAPYPDSLSGFVLLLAVRGRTPHLAHHTVLFGGDGQGDADGPYGYDAEFDAVFGSPGRLVADPVLYVGAPDDPRLRPAGTEAWFVLVNAARHGTDGRPGTLDWDTPGLAAGYAERILTLLDDRGLGVRGRLISATTRTPADLERATGAPGGAIYGAADRGLRTALTRPRNTSPVRGLYLVGGSAHPGGGLPLVALSAAIVAQAVGDA